ncbi:MAG: alpha/beta hydrolase [bacterium]|nr:alpha/beta hydrolase [bacterium]
MKKRVFIAHGWEGRPDEGWFPWLTQELEARGFSVFAPNLPDAGNPQIDKWIPKLAQIVGTPDSQTYFVGHSMGCQAVARYLESLPDDTTVGGAVFVAGFFKRLTGIEDETKAKRTEAHWLGTTIDLKKVGAHMQKSVAIFSDNDPFVPLDNQDDFRDQLGSEIIIQKHMGHFTGGDDGILELPIVLESLLKIAR